MIDLSDEDAIADAVQKIQEGIGQVLLMEIRDEVGLVLERLEITASYLKHDGETYRHARVVLMPKKDEFENLYLEFAKRRLLNDARQLIGLDPDDEDSPLSADDDAGETPDEAATGNQQ